MREMRERMQSVWGEISGGSETGRERRVRSGGVSFRLSMFLVHCLECVLYRQECVLTLQRVLGIIGTHANGRKHVALARMCSLETAQARCAVSCPCREHTILHIENTIIHIENTIIHYFTSQTSSKSAGRFSLLYVKRDLSHFKRDL